MVLKEIRERKQARIHLIEQQIVEAGMRIADCSRSIEARSGPPEITSERLLRTLLQIQERYYVRRSVLISEMKEIMAIEKEIADCRRRL